MTHTIPKVPVALSYVPNQLFIMLDDVGPEQISALDAYTHYTNAYPYAATPWLDFIFKRGVAFDRFYTCDICSPTRSNLLSGQYAHRTGIGHIVSQSPTINFAPKIGALSLPKILLANGIGQTEVVGKWHLGNDSNTLLGDYKMSPNDAGFGYYAGCLLNVATEPAPPGASYFNWYRVVNGVQNTESTWNPTKLVDDLLTRMVAPNLREPFFIYWPQNTAHTPTTWPPGSLHSFGSTPSDGNTNPVHWNTRLRAHIEAWDTELGRFFQGVDPEVLARTMIYVCGDNGTGSNEMQPVSGEPGNPDVTPYDFRKFKATPYEGGQKGWLVVSGPLVEQPGRFCHHYVDSVDIYSTILHIAGITTEQRDEWLDANFPYADKTIDGVSIMPHLTNPDSTATRDFSFGLTFKPTKEPVWTPADATEELKMGYRRASDDFKIIRWHQLSTDELYDLAADPLETNDLGESHAKFKGIRDEMEALLNR